VAQNELEGAEFNHLAVEDAVSVRDDADRDHACLYHS
jgi:hypothetical protein